MATNTTTGASILTWSEFCAEKNISPSTPLSQVFPSGIVADIDNYKVPAILKATYPTLAYSQACIENQIDGVGLENALEVYFNSVSGTPTVKGVFATTSSNYYNSWVMSDVTSYSPSLGLGFIDSSEYAEAGYVDGRLHLMTYYREKPYEYLLDAATTYAFLLATDESFYNVERPLEASFLAYSFYTDYEDLMESVEEAAYLTDGTYREWTYAPPLSTPIGLNATNITSDSALVSWAQNANASNFKIEYKINGDTSWTQTTSD